MLSLGISVVLLLQSLTATVNAAPLQLRDAGSIPQYVLDYAPLVWLDKKEVYYPSDIQAQFDNTFPALNYTPIDNPPSPLTVDNANLLDNYGMNASQVYLTSKVDITTNPAYLYGVKPDASGVTEGAVSGVIVVNDYGNGQVDGFYFFFYAYNQGNKFTGVELGDHVGDWEHISVRFINGEPTQLWYSQHSDGEAFTYNCTEKIGVRPVGYSARGTHASYAINGHVIPGYTTEFGPILDYTSQGTLWDPLGSAYFYTWEADSSTFTSSPDMGTAGNPEGFMHFYGRWGDEQYNSSDPRQLNYLGLGIEYRYVSGPTGPWDKDLNRTNVCPDSTKNCDVHTTLVP